MAREAYHRYARCTLAERVVVLSCQVSKGTCTSSHEHVEQHMIRYGSLECTPQKNRKNACLQVPC